MLVCTTFAFVDRHDRWDEQIKLARLNNINNVEFKFNLKCLKKIKKLMLIKKKIQSNFREI